MENIVSILTPMFEVGGAASRSFQHKKAGKNGATAIPGGRELDYVDIRV